MPASIFELLFMYFTLLTEGDKGPSMRTIARRLDVSYSSIVIRRNAAIKFGIMLPPEKLYSRNGEWVRLTTYGAYLLNRCMEGLEEVVYTKEMRVSPYQSARPPKAVYKCLSKSEYLEYSQRLKKDGLNQPTL